MGSQLSEVARSDEPPANNVKFLSVEVDVTADSEEVEKPTTSLSKKSTRSSFKRSNSAASTPTVASHTSLYSRPSQSLDASGMPMLRSTLRSVTSIFGAVDADLDTAPPSPHRKSDWRLTAMTRFSMTVIVLNTVFIGYMVNVDLEAAKDGESLDSWLQYVDITFTVVFCFELVLLLVLHRGHFFTGEDRLWNFFEASLILSSVLEWSLQTMDLSFVRSLRIFKAIRVVRVFRVVRFVRELRVMVASVLCSLASLTWAIVFLAFVLYLFSLVIIQDVSAHIRDIESVPNPLLIEYYGSLLDAMITLFMAITGGDDWRQLLEPLQEFSKLFYTPFFIFYVAFTVFGVMNVLTATFVEAASRISNIDRDLVIQEQMSQTNSHASALRKVFHDADTDGGGQLDLEEFEAHLHNREVLAYLKFLEIDIYEARGLFQLLDVDETGAVEIDEFVVGMMRLKGAAKGVDVATLMYENKKIFVRLVAFMKFVEDNFRALGQSLDVDMSKLGHLQNSQHYIQKEEQEERVTKKRADATHLTQEGNSRVEIMKGHLENRRRDWRGFTKFLGKRRS